MSVGAERGIEVRRIALLTVTPAAAFAVHQLRYWLAYGGHAGAQLQAQGHSYLHSLVPWMVLLLAVSAGAFLRALGRAFGGQPSRSRSTASFALLWLVCAAALVMIYAAQESLEGLLVAGHPGGLVGIFAYGGWWSVPAALAVGLVVAAAFHGANWLLRVVAERHERRGVSPRAAQAPRLPAPALLTRLAPLAGGWSGRGPPA